MQIIRDLAAAEAIADPEIRRLVLQRVADLAEQGFDLAEVGHFLIVESTDTLADIEQHLGVSVRAYELIEAFPTCLDVVYVLDQAGMAIEMFIPKSVELPELLARCLKGPS